MTRLSKALSAGAMAVVLFAFVFVYALFHGYFDHGHFEIKSYARSSVNQVAVVAERWDADEALGGLDSYVVLGNHLFSPDELRHAYYSDAVVFAAESTCATVHWESEKKLQISCKGSAIDKGHINAQRQQDRQRCSVVRKYSYQVVWCSRKTIKNSRQTDS